MGRLKNDGRGQNGGGRKKGTPNRIKPIKQFLQEHSENYFMPKFSPEEVVMPDDKNGEKKELLEKAYSGRLVSQFDIDFFFLKPVERTKIEVDLLQFHTPKQQAVSADMQVNATNQTLAERLTKLAAGDEILPED